MLLCNHHIPSFVTVISFNLNKTITKSMLVSISVSEMKRLRFWEFPFEPGLSDFKIWFLALLKHVTLAVNPNSVRFCWCRMFSLRFPKWKSEGTHPWELLSKGRLSLVGKEHVLSQGHDGLTRNPATSALQTGHFINDLEISIMSLDSLFQASWWVLPEFQEELLSSRI